jgi:ubiquinone biosynthesis protein UbiJ
MEFRRTKLKKLKVKLRAHKVAEFSFQLQVHPTTEQVAALCALLDQDVTVTLEAAQGDLDLVGDAPAQGELIDKPRRRRGRTEQLAVH